MSSPTAAYIDPRDGTTYPLDRPLWSTPDQAPLMITDLPGIGPDDIVREDRSLWRYRAAFPMELPVLSLGEGMTPLIESAYGGAKLHFKLEWFAPTGSFKDRGAAVMVAYLKAHGITAILEDSSGNGGGAISCYGAAAGMRVRILAPSTTSPAKTAQMRAFNAEVQLVPGPRDECSREAIRQSAEIFYGSHAWQPFFLQGTKTLAYELWEQNGFVAPDNVIIPCGGGSNVMGCDIGFSELLAAGQIQRLPRLFAVQPANCAPIHASFDAGTEDRVDVQQTPTLAEGASIKLPVRLREVLRAVRRSNGATVAVGEDQILDAVTKLLARGLFAEPTSAMAAAAAEQLLRAGTIRPEENTVVVLTGSGLKASAFMTERFGQ